MKHWQSYCLLFCILFSISCNKETVAPEEMFYGKWATNYGDTISFFSSGTKNSVTYKDYFTQNRVEKTQDYTFQNKMLGIKNWLLAPPDDYKFFNTFVWIQEGQVFEVNTLEWHPFRSSIGPNYRFTKIRQ